MKLLLVWNGYQLKQEMSERGGAEGQQLVISGGGDPFLNVLSAKRSPHLHVGYSGGGDPLLNLLSGHHT